MKKQSTHALRQRSVWTTAAVLFTVLLLAALPAATAFAADSGFQAPTTNCCVEYPVSWTDPQNGYASDDNRTSAYQLDSWVAYYGFSFPSMPAGTTIDGIEVSVEGYSDGRQANVLLSWSDQGWQWTTPKSTALTSTETVTILGGPTDTWGIGKTLIEEDFSGGLDNTFWVGLVIQPGGYPNVVYVDQVRVKIYYTKPSYTLTYTAGANGTISGTSPQTVLPGASGTAVTAVPNLGHHFVNWSDGSTANPRTDTNVTADVNVTSNFAIDQFTLTYTPGANGTITGTSPQSVDYGEDGTAVTAVPNLGYHFVNWSDSSTANPRTDTNVTADVNVTANFAIDQFTLTYTPGANGTITGTSPQTVDYGEDGTAVTAVPNLGYHFVNWSDSSTANPRTDTNVTADVTVTANFAINTYTLTYTPGANGTITGASPQTVNFGADGTAVTAVPDLGYHLVNWSDGSTANPRTDTNVTANVTVTANFAINTYTLTYTPGSGGTISGTSPQIVDFGQDGTPITAIPNLHYHFVGWSDGVLSASRTDTNVTANITVTANFAIDTYTLTYTAGANGTISGTSPQTVGYGASGTAVTAVPNPGYHFVDWSDGSTANPRTDTNVTADLSVTAAFAEMGSFVSWAGSVSITSDHAVVAVARPHVGNEVASYDGVSGGGLSAYVPMLFKSSFGGSYNAALYVQNIDPTHMANITVKFYDSAGTLSCTETAAVTPLASKGYWVPDLTCLPAGWVGGAVIISDYNIVAVGRPHVGSQVMTYNGFSSGSLASYLPMLFKTAWGSYDAAFYVQNVDTADTANITIKFYDSTGALSCTLTDTVAPLASKGWWVPFQTCLPLGWVGGAVVTSDQPVVTIGRLHVGAEVTSYSGFAGGSPSMYVPMLFKGAFGGSYDSAFYVQNVDTVDTANITMKFYDSTGALSCELSDTVAPLASKGFWVPSQACLPVGWVGAVVVTSDQPIVSVGRPHVGAQVTSYPGIGSGGNNLYLPMLFKNAFGGSYNSAFYVQNTDEVNPAVVILKFYDLQGNLSCMRTDTIPALATLGFWVPSVTCE